METVDLTPDWVNVGRFMANALKNDTFASEEAKYIFSTEFQKVLAYLKANDPAGYRTVIDYANRLADSKVLCWMLNCPRTALPNSMGCENHPHAEDQSLEYADEILDDWEDNGQYFDHEPDIEGK